MNAAAPGAPHASRRLLVLIGLNCLLMLGLAQVEWNVAHAGDFGVTIGTSGSVHAVVPNGPAARAGIRSGDFVALGHMPPTDKLELLYTAAGTTVTLPVYRHRVGRTVHVTAAPVPPEGWWGRLRFYLYPLLALLALGLATAVVLLRPGAPAWTYYAFVWLSTISAFQNDFYVHGSVWAAMTVLLVYQIAFLGALYTLSLFSTRLFNPQRAWQRRWETSIGVAVAIDFAIWFYFLFAYVFHWWAFKLVIPVLGGIGDITVAALVLAVLATMVGRSQPERRQRVMWVFIGLALQPSLIILNALQDLLLVALANWSNSFAFTPLYSLLEPWAALIGALAVTYAFVNEHIIDIRFAIGRASGYAITSALLILFMAIAEWSLGELFADSHVAAYLTLAAAVLAAFSFNAVHKRIDTLLDLAFFRREFFAEQRLQRDARALAFVTNESTVNRFLIDEPVDALELQTAALFVLDDEGKQYRCTASRNWPDGAPVDLSADDPLVAELRSERSVLSLNAIGWTCAGLPSGALRPVIAAPALARGDLYAFVFYGAHRDGATLNPEERALLGHLVISAAATFDHLDATRARAEIDRLKGELARLNGPAALGGAQPA